MLNSIRFRLLAWFIIFTLVTLGLVVPLHLVFRHKEHRIADISDEINSLHINFLNDNRIINEFLTTEPANARFFIQGESSFLTEHARILNTLNSGLSDFATSDLAVSCGIRNEIELLARHYASYNSVFDSLVYLVYKRGYRNYGLRGEFADYSERVQRSSLLAKAGIDQLKEIQNAYFLNSDAEITRDFKEVFSKVKDNTDRLIAKPASKAEAEELLNGYASAFLRLAELDEQTGITGNKALKASLNRYAATIESIFGDLDMKTKKAQLLLLQRLRWMYFVTLLLVFISAVFFSYKASKHVVSHLEALAGYIASLARHENPQQKVNFLRSTREIKQIYKEFQNLLAQLKIWEKQRNTAIQFADDNQQRYRELADMLPQSVFETDSYGNYTYVNKAWYQAFGYTVRELNDGLNLIETLVSETGTDDILGIRKIENCTFMAIRKNGSRFPASVYTDNIVNGGKVTGRRGIIIDITDRVNYIKTLQLETTKAKTSDELKSSFLANMSHEIRTPMNSIIGFSNLLASEQVPDTQKKDFTHYIQTSSEFLLNLVDDIIDFAKIDAGELKIVKKECDLNEVGNELITVSAETRKRFNKQHLQIQFIKDPVHPNVLLKTDPFRLKQILVNLINNAIKFTETGSVEFGYVVKDDVMIEFYVKDTGPGLSRDELDQIFERFKRSRRSVEKNIAGTGLGLAISKNLVQLLGGEMWVNSIAGSGTKFIFTLPYLKVTRLSTDTTPVYDESESYDWQGKKILIVEDDLNSLRFLNVLLKKSGIEIIHAANGQEAVEIISSDLAVDIVLMDIQLPVMNGLEATRIIKELRSNVPVIAQTAHAMAGDRERMKQAGCDDYVSKPLNPKDLYSVINHFLTDRHVRSSTSEPSATSNIYNPRTF